MKVQDVMTRTVGTCEPQETLHDAARRMWERDLGCLVVVGTDARPMAMLTDRDVCMAAFTTGKPLHELRVAGAMSKQLVSCRNQEELPAAAARMGKHAVRRLPVLDATGALVGVLGLHDLAEGEARTPAAKGATAAPAALRTLQQITARAPTMAPAAAASPAPVEQSAAASSANARPSA
jgi:CBS domain-containing protein